MFESNVNLWKCKFQSLQVPIKSCKKSISSVYDPTESYLLAEKMSR